jgi:hypothetical protein
MRALTDLGHEINSSWHFYAVWGFMAVVAAHMAEHAVQAVQIFVLGWDRPESRGLVGQWFPWLVSSETLHYLYAIFTLSGIMLLLPGFVGAARFWWVIALLTQFWHHFEHFLLLVQRLLEDPFFGQAVPTSIVQLWLPRVELHLFYNAVVFVPLVLAVVSHHFPSAAERAASRCDCAARFPRHRLGSEASGA